jgi:hypothetical protein
MAVQTKYIYGIIEEPEQKKFAVRGIEDSEVYTINFQNAAAVVSSSHMNELDPTRKNILAHTLVQDELLKKYTFLPMGFGTISASEESVRQLLEKNYCSLVEELGRLSGKIEAELKIFWDEKALMNDNQEFLSRMKAKIKSAGSPVEAQRLAIEAGMSVERIIRDWKTTYADRIYSILKAIATDARMNAPAGIKNLLNASFLIERTRENEFVEQVRRLDAEYRGKMNFKFVGPLSPYNFVGIKLETVK